MKKCVGTFHTFLPLAVGADLCVRPAETLYGSLPFFGEFVMPTTGGHMGPPLRRDTNTVREQVLRRCHKMHLFTQLWAQK